MKDIKSSINEKFFDNMPTGKTNNNVIKQFDGLISGKNAFMQVYTFKSGNSILYDRRRTCIYDSRELSDMFSDLVEEYEVKYIHLDADGIRFEYINDEGNIDVESVYPIMVLPDNISWDFKTWAAYIEEMVSGR